MSEGSLEDRIANRREFLTSLLKIVPSSKHRFSSPVPFDGNTISSWIDHTILKPDATSLDIQILCQEAIGYDFKAVCVNGIWTSYAFSIIEHTTVRLCCVVGFPLGATCIGLKAMETKLVIEAGADEVDMVIPIGMLKEGNFQYVYQEIYDVVQTAANVQRSRRGNTILIKVILESGLLTEEELIDATILAELAGAHFVKTSTGFSPEGGGATLQAVQIMKTIVGNNALVKASGGIRTLESTKKYIDAGVSRIGTSSGITIIQQAKADIPNGSGGGDDDPTYPTTY